MTRQQASKHGCKRGRIRRRETGSKTLKSLNGHKRIGKHEILQEVN